MALLRHVCRIKDPLGVPTSSTLSWFGFESVVIVSGLVAIEVYNAVTSVQ
jgi:hypothetical protein